MTPDERQALRDKHHLDLGKYCNWCDSGPFGKSVLWPCDVIKVLDELDRVANAAEIYGITIKHLTERNIESKVLAVIHAYDETAESKLSRIWQILGEKA